MRKLILAISMLAFAGSAAFADPIQERQAIMKERGKIAGQLSKVVKGETPYDAAAVLAALKSLEANAEKFHANVDDPFPGWQRHRRHHRCPKNLGRYGRLQGG